MTARRQLGFVLFLLVTGLGAARADGPHIALHAVAGGYEVTLFSAPDPLVAGPVQLTVLVQDAQSGTVLSPVSVTGSLSLKGASAHAMGLHFAHAGSSNLQLPGQALTMPAPGDYMLLLRVQAPGRLPVVLHGDLPAGTNRGRRDTVLWAVFAVAGMICLFLANQKARQAMQRHQARSR